VRSAVAALVAGLAATAAFAGRPLTTDDAAIVEDKGCQLEAWVDRSRSAVAAWAAPACNFGLGIEWQLGFARTRPDASESFSDEYAQFKFLLREPTEASTWGVGVTVGGNRHPGSEKYRGWGNAYVLVPVTVTSGLFTLHVQPGWARDRAKDRDVVAWGVGGEADLSERVTIVAEAFGENARKPYLRAGFRWTAIRDHLSVDLTQVVRSGGTRAERYTSLGFAWQTGRILP
jgi:hypothetical protein